MFLRMVKERVFLPEGRGVIDKRGTECDNYFV